LEAYFSIPVNLASNFAAKSTANRNFPECRSLTTHRTEKMFKFNLRLKPLVIVSLTFAVSLRLHDEAKNDGMKRAYYILLAAGGLLSGVYNPIAASSLVNFTASIDTDKDPGAYYNNLHQADRGFVNTFTVGFQVMINSVDGTDVDLGPIATFCSELQEPIDTESYTFTSQQLQYLAAGQADDAGTASSSIPEGGIGLQRAAYISYLFDRFYTSEALSDWTYSQTQPTTQAFQLAIWELTHDSDFSLTDTTGAIYIGDQTADSATITLRQNAIILAQSMIDEVYLANISDSYVSTNFTIWALVDDTGLGSTGYQDIILAVKKDSLSASTLESIITIPEPSTSALAGLAAGGLWILRRLRRHLYS
jgi:hypothetical protein